MNYTRSIEFAEQDDGFRVGDMITFSLTDGETVEAMAVMPEPDGMIFCAVDCLEKEYPMMRRGNKGKTYEESDLRKELNGEILQRFPEDIRARMIPFENGDLLRIPTEREIFGENEYGVNEPEAVAQWDVMKLRRNRIAFQGHNGAWEWYWLQNHVRDVASAALFAYVYGDGCASYSTASVSLGVRPAFKISKS